MGQGRVLCEAPIYLDEISLAEKIQFRPNNIAGRFTPRGRRCQLSYKNRIMPDEICNIFSLESRPYARSTPERFYKKNRERR